MPTRASCFAPVKRLAVAESDRDASLLLTLAELRHLMLGADIHPAEAKKLVEDYARISQLLPPDHRELNRAEDEILSIYIDISALFRRQAAPEDKEDAGRISSGEYLLTYLRTLDSRGTALPASFLEKVRRALRYYGDDSLDPTPELKGLLLLIYKSHQNMEQRVPVITAILERRLACAAALAPHASPEFSLLLDRLAAVSKGRFPALSDLAREIKYRYYDLPVFEKARSAVYAEMEDHLAHLLRNTGAADRAERVQSLVQCPYPVAGHADGPIRKRAARDAPADAGGADAPFLPDTKPREFADDRGPGTMPCPGRIRPARQARARSVGRHCRAGHRARAIEALRSRYRRVPCRSRHGG